MNGNDHVGALEESMARAVEGDAGAARLFFERLLEVPLVVPERRQDRPLSDAPVYPNDFLNVLGVQGAGRIVVPTFSRAELIEGWCGASLRHRSMRLGDIIAVLPDDWWVCVNPGAEFEKEISPWELALLRTGRAGIDELIEEFTAESATTPVEVRPPRTDEYIELRRGLVQYAEGAPGISRLFLLCEDGGPERGKTVVIGAEGFSSVRADLDVLKASLEAEAARALIGGDAARVFVGGVEDNNFALSLFQGSEPIFTRAAPPQRGIWGALKRLWSPR